MITDVSKNRTLQRQYRLNTSNQIMTVIHEIYMV